MSIYVLELNDEIATESNLGGFRLLEDTYPEDIHELTTDEYSVTSMIGWRLLTTEVANLDQYMREVHELLYKDQPNKKYKSERFLNWYVRYPHVPQYHEAVWINSHDISLYSKEWLVQLYVSKSIFAQSDQMLRGALWCGRTATFVRAVDPKYSSLEISNSTLVEFLKIVKPKSCRKKISQECKRFWEGLVYLIDEGFVTKKRTIDGLRKYIDKLAEGKK